jgi:hypothetical protein
VAGGCRAIELGVATIKARLGRPAKPLGEVVARVLELAHRINLVENPCISIRKAGDAEYFNDKSFSEM